MEDKDDFIYSYFNGRSPCPDARRRDAQPRQSRSISTLACRKHTATEKKPANVKGMLLFNLRKSFIICFHGVIRPLNVQKFQFLIIYIKP